MAANGSVITAGTNITISGGTISSSGGGGSITLSAIGSSPNANAATLTGSALNLEPASASFGGVVTTGTQTFAGAKTFSSTLQTGGITGIAVAPFTNTLSNGSLDLAGGASVFGYSNQAYFGNNLYYNSNFIYKATSAASLYYQDLNGSHLWLTAPSGTINTAVTLTERMRLTQSGYVGIGTNNPLTTIDSKQTTTGTATANATFRDNSTNGNALQIWNGNNEARFRALYYGTPSDQNITFWTITSGGSEGERMRITSGGVINTTSRLNVNGATDNSLFSLSTNGTLYTIGFSPNATANSTNTLTLTTAQTTWIYNGSGTASWTLPNPSGTNQMFWIKNAGTGIITLNAYSGTNIINNAAASVSSITIAIGATVLIQQDGNVKSYQLQ